MDARDRHNGQRDKRTNGRTDGRRDASRLFVRPSVRLLDGVWHWCRSTLSGRVIL